jgi:hypothetical protein
MEKTFEVTVMRISYASRKAIVTANSEDEAKEKALNTAGDYTYSEHDADYSAENVKDVS